MNHSDLDLLRIKTLRKNINRALTKTRCLFGDLADRSSRHAKAAGELRAAAALFEEAQARIFAAEVALEDLAKAEAAS